MRNARIAYQARLIDTGLSHYDALETLRSTLALPAIPRRIECFDISTIQGSETVASMVVCEDGRMRRADYRKFRIKGLELAARRSASSAPSSEYLGPTAQSPVPSPQSAAPARLQDDFAAMHEVVLRRYRKLLELGGPFPDLVLIDGGKGQLTAAYAALEELGLANLVAIGIAKKEELIYTREHENPIALPAHDPALLLIQRIRDEAHRFAVTFHRKARSMRDLRSELDEVPGVGARRRNALLRTFGSLAGVRRATREELAAAVGAKTADAVLAFFASRP
jgi:excinuclease ABC subunit C